MSAGTAIAALRLTHDAYRTGDGGQELRLLDTLLASGDLRPVVTHLARTAVSLGVLLEETHAAFSLDQWLTDLAFQDVGNGVNVTNGSEGGEGYRSPQDPPAPAPEAS